MTVRLGLQDAVGGGYETSIDLPASAVRTVYVPFSELEAAGIDTTRMGAISFRSNTQGLFAD